MNLVCCCSDIVYIGTRNMGDKIKSHPPDPQPPCVKLLVAIRPITLRSCADTAKVAMGSLLCLVWSTIYRGPLWPNAHLYNLARMPDTQILTALLQTDDNNHHRKPVPRQPEERSFIIMTRN